MFTWPATILHLKIYHQAYNFASLADFENRSPTRLSMLVFLTMPLSTISWHYGYMLNWYKINKKTYGKAFANAG